MSKEEGLPDSRARLRPLIRPMVERRFPEARGVLKLVGWFCGSVASQTSFQPPLGPNVKQWALPREAFLWC